MRVRGLSLGLGGFFLAAAVCSAQQPVPTAPPITPVAPVAPTAPPVGPIVAPFVPAAAPAASPLDTHLVGWEKSLNNVVNFRFEIEKTSTTFVTRKERKAKGVVLCMKPNFAILRLDYDSGIKGDYEGYICNGKSVFQYAGLEKTITEIPLPNPIANPGAGTQNVMLDFLSGIKAQDAKQRFDITLRKEDEYYIYLEVKPKLQQDMSEFKVLNIALYSPKVAKLAYFPCKVVMLKNNDDQDVYDFKNPQTNLEGISDKTFNPPQVEGFQYRKQQPPPPQQRPGTPGLLPGGNGMPQNPGIVRP
jgi:TIGR03009 family protein